MELSDDQLNSLRALPLEGWMQVEDYKEAEKLYTGLLELGLVDVKDEEGGGYNAIAITDLGKIHLRRHMLR